MRLSSGKITLMIFFNSGQSNMNLGRNRRKLCFTVT